MTDSPKVDTKPPLLPLPPPLLALPKTPPLLPLLPPLPRPLLPLVLPPPKEEPSPEDDEDSPAGTCQLRHIDVIADLATGRLLTTDSYCTLQVGVSLLGAYISFVANQLQPVQEPAAQLIGTHAAASNDASPSCLLLTP